MVKMFEKIDHKLLSHRKSIASCAILLDIDHHHNLLKDKVHPSMFNTLTSTELAPAVAMKEYKW